MSTLDSSEDKGQSDPELLKLLSLTSLDKNKKIIDCLKNSRLIGAIVAQKGVNVEMMQALFKSNDGRMAMLVFTSTVELSLWDKNARPVPLMAPEFAKQVLDQKLDALIIDISSDHRFVIEGANLEDLARGKSSIKVEEDEQVIEIIEHVCFRYPEILKVLIEKGQDSDLDITLVGQDIDPDLVINIGKILAEHEIIRQKAPRGTDLFVRQMP